MAYYHDLRDYISVLEEKGKLFRIKRPVVKETELMPLVRWQFRGLKEEERRAFLFENVIDLKGRKYDIPVLVACYAASRQVYALGMQCEPGAIMEKWAQAQLHPVPPVLVDTGPVHEEVHQGETLLEHSGLEEFPIPISTPGFDNAPYFTSGCWVTKDPETGIHNVGVYRGMVKSPTRVGVGCGELRHLSVHRRKWREAGRRYMEAALVVGVLPNLAYCAVSGLPYGTDEYAVAGGISGEPLELVRCKTIDLEVPATAEIVIEGVIDVEWLEREGPFGEYTGYIGRDRITPFFEVRCITHRKRPIYNAFISQFPPSESSKLRGIACEGVYYKFLKYDCNIPTVLDVAFHESSGSWQYCVVQMKKTHPSQPRQALNGVATLDPNIGKIVIVVDEDIDPRDPDSVNWALSFRMQPARDIQIIQGRMCGLDPSGAPQDDPDKRYPLPNGGSSILIDATRKFPYPPVALPRREFMERAREIWEAEGLPPLTPKVPWYGYELGYWSDEDRQEAELALSGEHYATGTKLAGQRKRDGEVGR